MPSERRPRGRRGWPVWTVAPVLFAQACAAVSPPEPGACEPAAAVAEVAAGVYVRPGRSAVVFAGDNVANIGFVVGERCVAVIDTGGSAAEGRALRCAIRNVTDRPVCYVLNTHVHPDHVLGNIAFDRPGVEFVGHVKLSRAMALRGDVYLARASAYEGRTLGSANIVFPERTVNDEVQLDIGDRILTARAHGSAHTDHDLSVVDELTNTAFVGDLVFLEHLPVLDGSINGWLAELQRLTASDMSRVVPGHGPASAAWPNAAAPTRDYLLALREDVRAWIAGGGGLAAAQDKIKLRESADWRLVEEYHERNVGAAYAELEWED